MTQAQNDLSRREEAVARSLNAELPAAYQKEIHEEGLAALKRRQKAGGDGRRKILLVGGAGYVGSVVTERLLDAGYDVRCFDLLLYGNEHCVLPHWGHPRYEFVHGDLCDGEQAAKALRGVSDVVLLAGLVGDPITKKYPQASAAINDKGLADFLDSLNGRGLDKVVFISTCSNYGLIKQDVAADEDFELAPLSLYAKAKVAAERKILALKGKVDYSPAVLRFATAFGLSPRMRFDLTVNEFTREMHLRRELTVFDAETWRPYCHLKDFALAIRRVLEAPVPRVAFEVFNVGGEVNNCTKQMIVDKIRSLVPDAPVSYKQHGSDPRNYRVSFKKIRETLFFEPRHTVLDGAKELLEALRAHLFDRVEANKNFYGNYEIDYKGLA